MLVVDNNHHFGTSVPGAGAIHPICFWHKAVGRCIARYVCFTPSTGLSGSGVARYAILAINAANVRFLPVPSALPQRADIPGAGASFCK